MRSKANWLKDAIEMGDPEQLARHIQEMRSALSPFKVKRERERTVERNRAGGEKGRRGNTIN